MNMAKPAAPKPQPENFFDLGPAYAILDALHEDDERRAAIHVREMEKVRDDMDKIRTNPHKSGGRSFNESTLTGSFLAAIGIKKPKKPTLVELNMQEIDEREEKERAEKAKASGSAAGSARGEKIGVKVGVKKRKKRLRGRRT